MQAAEISEKAGPLVQLFRASHPTTPIILAEGTPAGGLWFGDSQAQRQQANNNALHNVYETLSPTDPNLHYVQSVDLFGSNPLVQPTVGGTHPSDLGAHDVATYYTSSLPSIIKE